MQVVLSIQAGKVLPSMLLQKLGVYSRRNHLYRAFSEVGRIERTLFLLEYMSDISMHQHIRAETTKVESYHQFTDWLAFGGPVLRSGDPVEQEKRIKRIGKLNDIFVLVSLGAHPQNSTAWTPQRLYVPLPAPAGQRAREVRGASSGCSRGERLGTAGRRGGRMAHGHAQAHR